ncbi:MAG: hypothetical protein Q9M97_06850 [Candidatus Gracilibacteria bacterium]|nr:hypothetical protein [Candidatus Gracilibacteria bacterium]
MSKLEEDESAVIQIVLKPISDDWQHHSTKESGKIMSGKKSNFTLNPFKIIVILISGLFSNQDENKSPEKDNNTSALSQERAKTVDEKGDKTGFETIIRIVVSGNNETMVETELTNIKSAFTQFNYPDFNKFSGTLNHINKFG